MIPAIVAAWLEHSALGIFIGLILFYLATGASIYWVCFRPRWRNTVSSFGGVVAPFFVAPSTVFALMMGFLTNDVWQRDRQAATAVLEEHDALVAIHELSALAGSAKDALQAATRDYVTSVLRDEWTLMQHEVESRATHRLLEAMFRLSADRETARSAGAVVQNTLLAAAVRVASARSTRMALSWEPDRPVQMGDRPAAGRVRPTGHRRSASRTRESTCAGTDDLHRKCHRSLGP